MPKIHILDQDVVNHIAAGEVVERPASVVKELVENAIDAGAKKITIRIKKGGIDLVEVIDDGCGMNKDDLELSIRSHSTSKLSSVSDLLDISTLGFRGEALASIAAVSDIVITTRSSDSGVGHRLEINKGDIKGVTSTGREKGTTVTVERLFEGVPARRKFLKTPETEARKVLETFVPIALIHPEIHFIYEVDGKVRHTIPMVKNAAEGTLHPQRINELFSDTEFVNVFYDGDGMTIGGVIAHPEFQKKSRTQRYVFVNGRPIWDGGIVKAVSVGTNRFLPEGSIVPFMISLSLPSQYVDVNVHPTKREIRFANPYRVYSGVEQAVKKAYEKGLGTVVEPKEVRLRKSGVVSSFGKGESGVETWDRKESGERTFGKPSRYDVERSIEFSKMILEDVESSEDATDIEYRTQMQVEHVDMKLEQDKNIRARQFLGRYIVAGYEDALLIIDQHAAAERIRFEKLLDDYAGDGIESQSVMMPIKIKLADTEALFVKEYVAVFERLGYELIVEGDTVKLASIPALLSNGDQESLFRSVLDDMLEYEQFAVKDSILKDKYRDSILVTMACHSSVRMNQQLNDLEAGELVKDLFKCENSYSCPHGRPIVWKVTSEDIDKRFGR